jgi:hypothetical protein
MMDKKKTLTMGCLLVVTTLLAATNTGAHTWGGYQRDECEGLAPVLVVCSTGAHFRFHDDATFRHGFTDSVGDDFTGTIESRLIYLGGERTFRCAFEDGQTVPDSCSGSGEFPPPQSYFVQVCEATGSGQWGCFMEHG